MLLPLPLVFLGALGIATFYLSFPRWIFELYVIASSITFAVYAWDKERARLGEWRVAETTLHLMDLFGGWPGALLAQRVFRHKNARPSFQVMFWVVVLGHLTAWGWLTWRLLCQ
ncbi:MAG: DUF1294 domain-containing protein [Terriglobia bacterium]